MSEPLVQLQHGRLDLAGNSILQDVSFNVHDREIVTLIGPNGAGKTTLVRVILGLQALDSGDLHRRAGIRIGYMPQRVKINDAMPLDVQGFLKLGGHKVSQVQQALAEAGVSALHRSPLSQISGGELQRVLFARALLHDPQLLVLDEPVQGVDLNGQAELYQLISDVRQQRGCAVLMVSHDLNIVMATTDTVICLNRHICCHGHPDHVSSDPAFHELFGDAYADKLAIYHHRHDHEHNIHGEVLEDSGCQHEQNKEAK